MEELIGLIPAAGKGVRLGLPYPKELFPIIHDNKYKPVSQYIFESMLEAEIKHVVLVINETKHQLIRYFGSGQRFNTNISYAVQESRNENDDSTSPGLADALNSAYHLVKGKTVCFGMADTIISPKDLFKKMLEKSNKDDDLILGLFPTKTPEKFGMIKLDDNNKIVSIVDKPEKTELKFMWGVIIWRPKFTEFLKESVEIKGQSDFADILNNAIKAKLNCKGIIFENGTYTDLGTFDELMKLYKKYHAP
ncbi:NTP transferase domain-containing protein [Candidatus Dependentiae bacterium]|nr:NTP transferase domain-containing protein [Candidatus Dependentiae bacterium]